MTQRTGLSTGRRTGRPAMVFVAACTAFVTAWCLVGMALAQEKQIRLIVRGDDIGSCHAANEACIQCFREGVVRSVEIMVPTPWYNEAVKMLTPGTWLLVDHPGLDVAEMRAIGHLGYEKVAADRAGVTRAFTSDKVKQTIQRRGIRLISYADFHGKK